MGLASKPIKIYKREALFIQSKALPRDIKSELEDKYTFRFYQDKACQSCEYLPDRHSDVCDNCAAYMGGSKLYKTVKLSDKPYISLPIGDKKGVERFLNSNGLRNHEFISKHPKETKLKKKIKFTGELRDYQPEAVQAMVEKKRGVMVAPARTGKTVMGAAAICRIGRKTLILASQHDWLMGFYETFCGSATQKALTNAVGSGATPRDRSDFFKKNKHANVGFCKKLKDFDRHDVCIATVQTFYSPGGEKLLRKLRDKFGAIFVDEIDVGAAPKYAGIIARLNTTWMIGLTGTPDRKDGKYILMDMLIGPIIYQVKVERLRPTVQLVRTQYSNHDKNVPWVRMVTKLECDPKRLKLIAKQALKDIEKGHMVLIPLNRVKAIKALSMAINKLAGKTVSAAFYGGLKKDGKNGRDDLITKARNYKMKCLVGQAKLLSRGINIPRASALYDVTPSSNLPNCQQRVSRIITAFEGKPPPLLRIFLDDLQARKACLRNEWFRCIRPDFKAIISEKNNIIFQSYLNNKEQQERWEW